MKGEASLEATSDARIKTRLKNKPWGRDGAPPLSHFRFLVTDSDSRAFRETACQRQSEGWREDASKAPSLPF